MLSEFHLRVSWRLGVTGYFLYPLDSILVVLLLVPGLPDFLGREIANVQCFVDGFFIVEANSLCCRVRSLSCSLGYPCYFRYFVILDVSVIE